MVADKRLLKPAEAAESLGLSRARLYQLLATGELGSVKIGASRRIPAADLDAFVQRLRSECERGHDQKVMGGAPAAA